MKPGTEICQGQIECLLMSYITFVLSKLLLSYANFGNGLLLYLQGPGFVFLFFCNSIHSLCSICIVYSTLTSHFIACEVIIVSSDLVD